jgi:hypothetical protein
MFKSFAMFGLFHFAVPRCRRQLDHFASAAKVTSIDFGDVSSPWG